jgi:YcaO cyclodehydratase, ATP-ad Mg2+-binding
VNMARLALREDAYYAPSPDGVVILTHQGRVSLTGVSIYQWIERLAPFLNGRNSLAELTAALPPERRQLVEQIVTTLLDRGVVRQLGEDEPHGLSAGEAATYRAELGFLGYFRDSAGRAFQRYRDSPALVLGAGRLLPAVVRAGLRSGLRQVRAVITPESPTDLALLEAYAQRAPASGLSGAPASGQFGAPASGRFYAASRDEAQRLRWHAQCVDTAEELATLLDGVELVIHVCDQPPESGARLLDRLGLLDRLCARRGILLAQAMAHGQEVWVGPAGRVGVDGPGGWDGWRRLAALGEAAAGTPAGGVAALSTATATVVANQLVQDLFRYTTGVRPPAGRPQMIRIQPDTLRGQTHRFLAHPFSLAATAETEAAFLARIAELEGGAPLEAEEFSRRAVAGTDARLGVFGEITERDFAQLPIHVTQASVSDPVGLLGTSAPRPVVTGMGVDFDTARHQAAVDALATYASLMVDPRRLLSADGRGPLPPDGLGEDLSAALAGLRSGEPGGWVRALGLADGRPQLLAAATVFPALGQPSLPYRPPVGVTAAYSWSDAVTAGLVAHCRQLTITETQTRTTPFPLVDVASVPADAVIRWCLAMVAALGQPVTVHEVTGSLGVPTFACSLAGHTLSYGCAVSNTQALRDGLLRLLLAYQAQANDEPAYAPAAVPNLAPHLRGTTTQPVQPQPELDIPALVAALARRGYHAAVVPLDHDQEVHKIMPYIAHVVVTHAGH